MKVTLTEHAVQRFNERVRPGLSIAQARTELRRLVAEHAEPCAEPPRWYFEGEQARADTLVRIGPDILLPCATRDGRLFALTVVCRGLVGDQERAYRRRRKLAERERKRASRPAISAKALVDRKRLAAF